MTISQIALLAIDTHSPVHLSPSSASLSPTLPEKMIMLTLMSTKHTIKPSEYSGAFADTNSSEGMMPPADPNPIYSPAETACL